MAFACSTWDTPRLKYDNRRDAEQDLTTVVGFLMAVQTCLRIVKDGLQWLGVPCASFSWLASSTHSRSIRLPFGDEQRPFVRAGNLVSSRAMILAILGISRGVFYFVENPSTSKLELFPYLRYILTLDTLNCRITQRFIIRWWPVLTINCSTCACLPYCTSD